MIADRWGVSDAEVARHYPCDDVAHGPALEAWRGVTAGTSSARLWPWVGQIRLAPYSYDWIDNAGRRSPRELRDLPEPRPGEPFTRVAGRPAGEIVSVEPGVQLTGRILTALMSYVLVPEDEVSTRLLLKVVLPRGRLLAPFVSVSDLVMARRQLLTLAALAEASPEDRRAGRPPR